MRIPHTDSEYQGLVELLDHLTDEVGEDENHPRASRLDWSSRFVSIKTSNMQKTVIKFRSFEEAEKADRSFYKKLTPQERLDILLELLSHGLEHRLERVVRIRKFSEQ